MRLPDPRRSRVVLIGTSEYSDSGLPDLPAIETTIETLAATLTDTDHGLVPSDPRHCVTLVNEGDLREVGRELGNAAEEAIDLLFVYYAGRMLQDKRNRSLHLALPDSDPKWPGFNSLEYAILRDTVLDSRATMKIIVLDSRFPDGMTGIGDRLDVRGGYVLASSFGEEVADVRPREMHTAFSWHLNTVLREGVPGGPGLLRIDDIHTHLAERMRHYGLPEPEARGTYAHGPLALMQNPGSLVAAKPLTGELPRLPSPVVPEPVVVPEPESTDATISLVIGPRLPPADEQAAAEEPAEEEPVRWFNEWMLDWAADHADRLTESASAVATVLLARAAASVEPKSERYAWFASRLAQAFFRTGELERAEDFVSLALDCTDDVDVRVHLHSTLAQCLDKAGSPSDALAVLGRALGSPGLTAGHRAGLLVLAARSHNNLGEFPKATEIASEALEAAKEAGDESAADWALHIISMAKAMLAADTDFARLQEC